ncbi:hypothetical protein AGDE_12822 [Angomonas deanei]|nr:hypothetical protein AGDE_12822 [Angomonas deanei]|eukprot:EPY23498.1 hypothetical protein AGDE_12822 [Angomonas deanei]
MGSQNSSTFMTERAYRNMESLRSTPNSRTNRKENVHRGALTNGRPQKKQDPFRDEENSGEEGPDALYQAYMDYTPWGIGESSSASYDATAMTIVGPEACRYRIHDWYYSFFRCLPYSETIILEEDFLGRTDHSNNNTSKRKEEVIYGQVKHIWEEELFLGVVEDLYDEIMETRDATPVNGPQHGGETATHVTSFTDGLCSLLHDEDGEETLPKVRKGSHCPCTVKPLLDNASRGNYNGSEAALLSLTDWIQAEDLLNEEVDDDDLSVGAPSSRSAEDTNHNNNTNTSFGHSSDDDPTTTKANDWTRLRNTLKKSVELRFTFISCGEWCLD